MSNPTNTSPPSPLPDNPKERKQNEEKPWCSIYLGPYWWLPFNVTLLVLAIVLEVVFKIGKENGFGLPHGSEDSMCTIYTVILVIIAMFITVKWNSVEGAIKNLQPYLDLSNGRANPQSSVLMNYMNMSFFHTCYMTLRNGHKLLFFICLLKLFAAGLEPLAAVLLEVKNDGGGRGADPVPRYYPVPQPGLNPSVNASDPSTFLIAAAFAAASSQYALPDPPYVKDSWTIPVFDISTAWPGKGYVSARIRAINSSANCVEADNVTSTRTATGYNNTAYTTRCASTWQVDNATAVSSRLLIPTCADDETTPMEVRDVMFWFLAPNPTQTPVAIFCSPSISIWEVDVTVNASTSKIEIIQPVELLPRSNASGPPWSGRVHNGLVFEATAKGSNCLVVETGKPPDVPSCRVETMQNTTRFLLPESVWNLANKRRDFTPRNFCQLCNQIYTKYIVTSTFVLYYLPTLPNDIPMRFFVNDIRPRLYLNDPVIHILAAFLIILSLSGIAIQIIHAYLRRNLRLGHEPGTIASALSLGGEMEISQMLNGCKTTRDFNVALRSKTFSLDPSSMKIVAQIMDIGLSMEGAARDALKQWDSCTEREGKQQRALAEEA